MSVCLLRLKGGRRVRRRLIASGIQQHGWIDGHAIRGGGAARGGRGVRKRVLGREALVRVNRALIMLRSMIDMAVLTRELLARGHVVLVLGGLGTVPALAGCSCVGGRGKVGFTVCVVP